MRLLPVLLLCFAACETPPPVREALRVESEAMYAFKDDHDRIVESLFSDLQGALEQQVRLIENYEIKAKGAQIAQADLMQLLEQARKKREEIAEKVRLLKIKVKAADKNFEIALQVHASVTSFLSSGSFGGAAVDGLMQQVSGLLGSRLKLPE